MAWTIQRTHAQPWASGAPELTPQGTIAVEWTGDPGKVWTTMREADAAEFAPALGAIVVHWGGLPEPENERPEDAQANALAELVERRAKAGDAIAIAAREALASKSADAEKGTSR